MPELPEVETVKRDLVKEIRGLAISQIDVYDKRVVIGSVSVFRKRIVDRQIQDIWRRGKMLVICLNNLTFITIQLRMTGHVIYGDHLSHPTKNKETKLVLHLSNGRYLNYNDHRMFGKWQHVDQLNQVSYIQRIGPEPLSSDFTLKDFSGNLLGRSSPVKTLLMNQEFIAGIGNIYASEICFSARIDPRRSASTLKAPEIKRLYLAMRDILRLAIEKRGTSMRNYRDASGNKGTFLESVKVYGRTDQPCYNCQKPVLRIVQSGRSTFVCDRCQN